MSKLPAITFGQRLPASPAAASVMRIPAVRETVRSIRAACTRALWLEVTTYPKPGLVSLIDNGSHRDMTAAHFWRSTLALRGYFGAVAAAGSRGADFAELRELGLQAEKRMLIATGGVNTHRGAIFNLGLLAAAAGHAACAGVRGGMRLGDIVTQRWGAALARHNTDPRSHGSAVARKHGHKGALAQAQAGFPTVYEVALPALRHVRAHGATAEAARVQAFFALLAALDDTNLLYRGGAAGLSFAQSSAGGFLERGGVLAPDWAKAATQIHHDFVARNLSPGGCADLLAAALLIDSLEEAAP